MVTSRISRSIIRKGLPSADFLKGLASEIKMAFSHPGHNQTLTAGVLPGMTSIFSVRKFHAAYFAAASLQVKVPALGESITDGAIAAILKQPGDTVEEDEPILQIDTDKVTIDVRSPTAGTLEAILVSIFQYVQLCFPPTK